MGEPKGEVLERGSTSLAPQEADSARTPREGDASSPTDLVRILKDLRKEGVIVPSRQFMKMIQAERKVEAKNEVAKKDDAKKDEKKDETQNARMRAHLEEDASCYRSDPFEAGDIPLLTTLVENVLDYCRTKLLDEELDALSMDGQGPMGRNAVLERAAHRRARAAMLLRRCTETYGQLLQVYSENKPTRRPRVGERADAEGTAPISPTSRSKAPGAEWAIVTVDDTYYRLASRFKPEACIHIQHDKLEAGTVRLEWLSAMWKSEVIDDGYFRFINRAKPEISIHIQNGKLEAGTVKHEWQSAMWKMEPVGDGFVRFFNRLKPSKAIHIQELEIHPTPFFEAVYALLARAVQQGMRAAAEGSRIAQEKGGMAQLAARVEEELGCLFRSREFGQNSGRGIRKGGAKVDAGGGSEGVESAQLAARAEAELGKLIKTASMLTSKLNSEFRALEETLHRNPQNEAKQSADQADKSAGAGGTDSKEAAAAAGDHASTAASVDALITWFKSRAPPRQRHADQSVALAHVISTRSPMINSLLPSPHDQALDLDRTRREDHQRQHRHNVSSSRSKKLNAGLILNSPRSSPSTRGGSEEKMVSNPPLLQNTWALAQERTLHRPVNTGSPIVGFRTMSALTW